jgi:hypothetical protein
MRSMPSFKCGMSILSKDNGDSQIMFPAFLTSCTTSGQTVRESDLSLIVKFFFSALLASILMHSLRPIRPPGFRHQLEQLFDQLGITSGIDSGNFRHNGQPIVPEYYRMLLARARQQFLAS